MTFLDFARKSGLFDPDTLPPLLCDQIVSWLELGHNLAMIARRRGADLAGVPGESLQALSRAHKRWVELGEALGQLRQKRAQQGAHPLPAAVLNDAMALDEVAAAERAEGLLGTDASRAETQAEAALAATAELFRRCMALACADGAVRAHPVNPDSPELADYEEHVGRSSALCDLPAHRWLALRRGEKDGVLRLQVDLPAAGFVEQAEALGEALIPLGGPTAVLDAAIRPQLEPALLQRLDQRARDAAVDRAARLFRDLLRAPAPDVALLGSLFLGAEHGRAGLAIVDRQGRVVASEHSNQSDDEAARLAEWFVQRDAQAVVVPTQAHASERLALARAALQARLPVWPVPPAGVAAARERFTARPLSLSPEVASAVVLAMRALRPTHEWARVDPAGLGLADYQADLDPTALRLAFEEVLALAKLETKQPAAAGHDPRSLPIFRQRQEQAAREAAAKAAAPMPVLNPMVQTLSDLRPGMALKGLVTNLSSFGAFINLGIREEGLVHVSELADEFVRDPADVVQPGQMVDVTVLSVDDLKRRIALTMRTRRNTPERRPRDGSPSRQPAGKRAEALRNLENLFRKDEPES